MSISAFIPQHSKDLGVKDMLGFPALSSSMRLAREGRYQIEYLYEDVLGFIG